MARLPQLWVLPNSSGPNPNPNHNSSHRSHEQSQPHPKPQPQPRARLPRDAHVSISTNPAELYISMTIRKHEHIQALLDTLQTFAPMIEDDR